MSQILSVALAWIADEKATQIGDLQFRAQQLIGMDHRYRSLTVWKDCDIPERYAALMHYDVEEDGEDLFETISDDQLYSQIVEAHAGPADVHQMRVAYIHAALPGQTQIGQMMSVSMRKADPGYEEDLLQELRDIFEGIKYIDGYLGSIFGKNKALGEEIIACAFWKDRHSFEESTPRGSFYEIRLYERVF